MNIITNTATDEKNRICPVCAHEEKQLLYSQHFSPYFERGLLDGYDVVVCKKCGFCFADKIPAQEVFDVYYKKMSKYENLERATQPTPFDLKKFAIIADFIEMYLKDKETKIFEIGCANGHFLNLLRGRGFNNIRGLDPSPACASATHQLYGIEVLTNTLSNVPIDRSIDFLVLLGVLEHVRDLDASSLKLNAMLRMGGGICIVVPDASRYSDGEDAPFQEFSTEHINFFGPTSLANLMRVYGFYPIMTQHAIIESAHKTMTPIIMAMYRKETDADVPYSANISRDFNTEQGLISYIDLSRQLDNRINSIINEIAVSHKPVIVWGTGALTQRLLANSSLSNATITAFVDSNPKFQGQKLGRVPIVSPADIKNRNESILISTHAYQNEILNIIRKELMLSNEVITLFDFHEDSWD
jgi:SAM-dependent methyltransferase